LVKSRHFHGGAIFLIKYLSKYEIRNTLQSMAKIKNEKRASKSYKIRPSIYKKAVKKANGHNTTLANVVEDFITSYIEFDPVIFSHNKTPTR